MKLEYSKTISIQQLNQELLDACAGHQMIECNESNISITVSDEITEEQKEFINTIIEKHVPKEVTVPKTEEEILQERVSNLEILTLQIGGIVE